jgi:integrase/recombinase XerC
MKDCIDQFLRYHLPRCDCLGGALRTPMELHAALMPVLEILRAEGVIARAPEPTGPIADELSRYDAHMSSARGLAAATRRGRLRIVERLLLSKFAGRRVDVSSLLARGRAPVHRRSVAGAGHHQQRHHDRIHAACVPALSRHLRRRGAAAAGRDRVARALEHGVAAPRPASPRRSTGC